MPFAIRVENLSKRYRIRHAAERLPYRTLRDDLVRAAPAPVRWLLRTRDWLRSRRSVPAPLSETGENGTGSDQDDPCLSRFRRSEDFWALQAVSFDVQPGEVLGIISGLAACPPERPLLPRL